MFDISINVSRFGLPVRRKAGKKDLGSIPLRFSSPKIVIEGMSVPASVPSETTRR